MHKCSKRIFRLIILALMLAGVMFVADIYIYSGMYNLPLNEKVFEYERHLRFLSGRIDFNAELGVPIYENMQELKLLDTINEIDSYDMTFAALYKYENGRITLLSERTPSYNDFYFDPMEFPEFRSRVKDCFDFRDKPRTVEIWLNRPEVEPRTMYVSFIWTPQQHETVSYLMVTAVSRYSLETHVPLYVYFVAAAKMFVIGLIGILILISLNKMSQLHDKSFYASRYGVRDNANK